jgi:hypothetical protein
MSREWEDSHRPGESIYKNNSDKAVLSKIYKELKIQQKSKQKPKLKKWAKDLNRPLAKDKHLQINTWKNGLHHVSSGEWK